MLFWQLFSSFFAPAPAAAPDPAASNKNASRTAKHRGSEGRGRPKKASRECLTPLLNPLHFWQLCSSFLLLLRLLFFSCSFDAPTTRHTPQKRPSRTAKHRGSEGRGTPKKAPEECLTSFLKPL